MSFLDRRNGNVYLVAADSTNGKPDAAGHAAHVFHANSFVVLTYKPR